MTDAFALFPPALTTAKATTATTKTAFVDLRAGTPGKRRNAGSAAIELAKDPNFDLSGNTWKPTEGRMHSTDTGDFAPTNQEDIDMMNKIDFMDGIYGSQVANSEKMKDKGSEIPGLDHLGEDAVVMGGIDVASEFPADMEFVPSSVPDGHVDIVCAAIDCNGTNITLVRH